MTTKPRIDHPAEITTGLLGTGGIAAALTQHNWLAAGLALIAYVPAIVTYLNTHGGISGLGTALWRGQR